MSNLLFAAKPILMDFLSTIVFACLFGFTHDLGVSLALSVAIAVAQLAWQRFQNKPIDLMQWASLGLVFVFGGAAFFTHDARFVLFKPTLIYIAIGATMLRKGWMTRYLPPIASGRVSADLLNAWGYGWAGLMFATAALNAGLAIHGDLKLWATAMAVVPLASKVSLFAIQYATIRSGVKRTLLRAGTEAQPA